MAADRQCMNATMDATIAAAFEPPAMPNIYRRLAWVPSVREVAQHLPDYHAYWAGEAERALTAGRPTLVVLGDSLAQGIGASAPDRSWAGRFRAHLGGVEDADVVPVLNLSRSGARIADVLDVQLPALVASGVSPLLVACTVGSNDLRHSFRLDRIRYAFLDLLAALPEGAVVATLPEQGSSVGAAMNRVIRREAAATGRPVAEVGRLLTSWRGRVSGDRFHPNDRGYEVWFEAFREAVDAPVDAPVRRP